MVFVLLNKGEKKMEYLIKKIDKIEEIEKRIKIICSYNSSKCEVLEGHIINVSNTNVSFIEPNRIIIKIKSYKLLIIYFDIDNIFLYDRTMPINYRMLDNLLKHIKSEAI